MSKNKKLTKIFKKFGIDKVKKGNEFAYVYEDNMIIYTTDICIVDDFFSDFLYERFDYDDKYPFAMSLLHEVGHHVNNDEIIDNIYAFCIAEKYKINKAVEKLADNDLERYKELNFQYFNLPDEIMATEWAVNYDKKHPKKLAKIEKIINK